MRHVCQPRLRRIHSGGLIRSLGTGGRERGRTGPATAVALGELPIVGAVPRMKWDLSDPNFATTLARRRTPVVLTDSETEDVAMAALALLSTLAKQTKLMKGIVSAETADVMYRIVRSTGSDALRDAVTALLGRLGHVHTRRGGVPNVAH